MLTILSYTSYKEAAAPDLIFNGYPMKGKLWKGMQLYLV